MWDLILSTLHHDRPQGPRQFRLDFPLAFDRQLVLKRLSQILLVAVAYYLAAWLGIQFAIPPGNASAVWPPSGLALAALLLGSRWNAGGIWAGAFFINLQTGVGGLTAAGMATGNTLAALLAAGLCLRFLDRQLTFRSLREPFQWLGITLFSCCVSASFGTASLFAAERVSDAEMWNNWLTWWLGDITGMMIVTPTLMALSQWRLFSFSRVRFLELLVTFVALALVCMPLFLGWFPGNTARGVLYLPILLLFWMMMRFELELVSVGIFVVAAIAVWGTSQNLGVFGAETRSHALFDLQIFLCFYALSGLLMKALLSTSRRNEMERLLLISQMEEARSRMKVAEEIQVKLFPEHELEGNNYRCSGVCRPAEETSGDYYDYFLQEDGQLVLMIGDVTGHGVGPAILMAETRAYSRALLQAECSLMQLALQMNRFLHRDTEDGRFITFMACRFNPEDRTLEYVGAGHDGVLVRRDGSTVTLCGSTIPLGLSEDLPGVQTVTIPLQSGDTLCLYTDGFLESQSESGELFGKDRFLHRLIELRAEQPKEVLEDLVEVVSLFMQENLPSDDQTAVVLRVE
jgi:sigma-B regulation protein RsbU (phosphoserine phosphatase)